MSNIMLSFIFSLGVAGWVYNQAQKRNGGLTNQSLIAAGVVGVMALIFFFGLVSVIL